MEHAFIRVNQVSKVYSRSFLGKIATDWLGGLIPSVRFLRSETECVALDQVSFKVQEGERVGIIGLNGAGKTTLLRLISGVTQPTSGSVETKGKKHFILDLGFGLREDLTGRENIFLRTEMMALSREKIEELAGEMIRFTDIGPFIDRPVRTYSAGMKARLAFSIHVHIEPEILIIDEALTVGDLDFVQKASGKVKEICQKGKILLLVSHNMEAIAALCTRSLWLDQGRLMIDGNPREVVNAYLTHVRRSDELEMKQHVEKLQRLSSSGSGCEIKDMGFFDLESRSRQIFQVGEGMRIRFKIRSENHLEQPDIRVSFLRPDGIVVLENWASEDGFRMDLWKGEREFDILINPLRLGRMIYRVHLEFHDRKKPEESSLLAAQDHSLRLDNPQYEHVNPVFFYPAEWRLKGEESKCCR